MGAPLLFFEIIAIYFAFNANLGDAAEKMVYFIQVGTDGPIKIGFTTNIEQRFRDLQAYTPFPLRVVGLFDGDINDEQLLHTKFSTTRLNNEWFTPSQELCAYIQNLNSIEFYKSNSFVVPNTFFGDGDAEIFLIRKKISELNKMVGILKTKIINLSGKVKNNKRDLSKLIAENKKLSEENERLFRKTVSESELVIKAKWKNFVGGCIHETITKYEDEITCLKRKLRNWVPKQ